MNSEDYSSESEPKTTKMISRSASKRQSAQPSKESSFHSSIEDEYSIQDTEVSQGGSDENDNSDIGGIFFEDYFDDDEDIEYVQQILGQKASSNSEKDQNDNSEPEYYAKFLNKSYRHCRFMTEMDLIITQGGEEALRRFQSKVRKNTLSESLTFPNLLTLNTMVIDQDWFEIDKIIDKRTKKGEKQFLVKWKSKDYEEATWESEDFIKGDSHIKEFYERKSHSNPKKIPTRFVFPPAEDFKEITEPPFSKSGAVLRDYQLVGLNWLRYCWYNKRNSILADEMGLGKTVQIVTTLNDLWKHENIPGPFLIVAPLSTLTHWQREFEEWSDFNAIVFHGSALSRQIIQSTELNVHDENGNLDPSRIGCDVVITTYETISKALNFFYGIEWRYLVADEGHKLKNYKGKRYKIMQKLNFEHCTLLTGTPIQNGMIELWSLLHFLQPDKFNDIDGFMSKYGNMKELSQVQEIQSIIKPLLLRRKKNDVEKSLAPKEETIIEVELTRIQKTFYRAFINQNSDTLLSQITVGSIPSLQNLMMQLRKVCNHPFLIKGAEDGIEAEFRNTNPDLSDNEINSKALIESSGKMVFLSKLLPKLKEEGHKILIFSQMVRVLDIIETYLNRCEYQFERIDGTLSDLERKTAIDQFNTDPNSFVFLLSTKAGGVGINLNAADTVIIYDSDWNPQNDIQAQARCHRIGQTAKVKVYRLISRGTYENEMFERASKKLGLDHVVLDGGDMKHNQNIKADEIEKILRKGAYGIFQDDNSDADNFVSANIDQLIERCSRSRIMDASGDGSAFSKATFQADENSVDFWAKIIPEQFPSADEDKTRKCRKDRSDQDNDLDDASNGDRIVNNLIDFGYNYTTSERTVLKIANSIKPPEDIDSIAIIHKLLSMSDKNDDDLASQDNDEDKNVDDLVKHYGEIALTVIDKAASIVSRVAFFARLKRALYFVQGKYKFDWPEIIPPWEDPFCEYSLMYGVSTYGWRNTFKMFENAELMLIDAKRLEQHQIEERIFGLIEILETQLDMDLMPPRDFTPIPPREWKQKNASLHAKDALYFSELLRLVTSIRWYGIKEKSNGQIDAQAMKEATDLECVPNDLVQEAIAQLIELTSTIKTETDTINFDGYPLLYPLIGSLKAKEALSCAKSISVMRGINKFVEDFCPQSTELVEKAPKNTHLPKWWTPEHDVKMIFAVHQYGTVLVSSWIVDPSLPFRQCIDQNLLPSFEKAAAKEKKKNQNVRPAKLGDFQFIYRKRSRLTRIQTVVDYVNKRIDKILSQLNSQYVMVPNSSLRIVSFGQYTGIKSKYGFCPVGYICERLYGVGKTKSWFRCEIKQDDKKKLLFSVEKIQRKVEDMESDNEYEGNQEKESNDENDSRTWKGEADSPSAAWKLALNLDSKSSTRLFGNSLFGLNNKKVKEKFTEMEEDYKEEHPDQPIDSGTENNEEVLSQGTEVDEAPKKPAIVNHSLTIEIMNPIEFVSFVIPVELFDRESIKEAFDEPFDAKNIDES